MTLARLRGQGEELASLQRQARLLRMHHAVLLEGRRGTGKSLAARVLAQALLCPDPDRDAPCGGCPTCLRVAAGAHPDLHVTTVPEGKEEIPVDAVRELQAQLARRPFEGRARVAILDPADRLNEQGQNALLKTLEEPGGATFLLLPCARPDALVETVRSRVARLRLAPLSDAELVDALRGDGVGENEAAWAAGVATGSLGLARELLGEALHELAPRLKEWWQGRVEVSPIALARALLHGATGRVAVERRARNVLGVLRALLRETPSLASPAGAAYLAAPNRRWPELVEAMLDAEGDLDLRIQPEHVLIGMFLRVQELRARQRLDGTGSGGTG